MDISGEDIVLRYRDVTLRSRTSILRLPSTR
jgi:hypothetical protein